MSKLRLACVLLLFLCASIRAETLVEMQDKSYPMEPNATFSVRNTGGTIYVYGSDRDELRVISRKKAYTKARLDGIAIKVKVEGGNASIDTVYPPTPNGLSVADRSGTVDYIIMVPERCRVSQVELGTGEIIVEGLRGPTLNVRLTSGRLIARNCFSDTHLSVGNGRCVMLYDWWEAGRFAVLAEIGQGHIWTLLPPDAALQLDASISNGGHIGNAFAAEGERESAQSLKTTIGSGEGAVFKLRAASGNIQIEKIH